MHFAVLQLVPVCHISFAAEQVSPHHMAHLCADLERVLSRLWPYFVIYLPPYTFFYLFFVLFILQNNSDAVLRPGHRRVAGWLSSL